MKQEKKDLAWYLYILRCANDNLYTGITNNLKRRIHQHRTGKGSRYTRAFGFKKLLYCEKHIHVGAALKREHELKKLSQKEKLALIKRSKQTLCSR